MKRYPDLAIMTFDLGVSGVVLNALRIAKAAHKSGLATELWVGQAAGQLHGDVPHGVQVFDLGLDIGEVYTRRQRTDASSNAVPALKRLLAERRPKIALSAGNHFHSVATAAFRQGHTSSGSRLLGRVSNAAPRWKWSNLPMSLAKRWAARQRFARMHRLIAVSEEIKSQLEHEVWVDGRKIVVIPNGIDASRTETLANEPLSHPWFSPDSPPVVLGVGRLVPQKGFDVLIRAFALARRRSLMRLVIVGDGPPETRNQLSELAQRLGVADDVWFAGLVANPFPFYRAAKLFVLSSRWEGMSNALLEAMACGCPSVSTLSPGSREVLADGRYGLLVPVGDSDMLASAIAAQLSRSISHDELRERAKDYDLRSSMRKYVRLFEEEIAVANLNDSRSPNGGPAESSLN